MAVATIGRPYVLYETLEDMAKQERRPDAICICPATLADVFLDRNGTLDLPLSYCSGSTGASAQRNAILNCLASPNIVVFVDDDFAMAPDFIAEVERLFSEPRTNGYGCNMAVRWSVIEATNARFDEALPLYSWGEDVDFSRQVSGRGRIVRSDLLRGVHRATKHGRTKGVMFGYSQIANQAYLLKKGTVRWRPTMLQLLRNVAANVQGSVRPERYIKRRGRLFGNVIGLVDLLLGRSSPSRILKL